MFPSFCPVPPPVRPIVSVTRRHHRVALEVYWQIGVNTLEQRVIADAIEQVHMYTPRVQFQCLLCALVMQTLILCFMPRFASNVSI